MPYIDKITYNGSDYPVFNSSMEYVNRFYFNLGVTPTTSLKGITYSIDEDGALTIDGTPTDKIYFDIMGGKRKTDTANLVADAPVILQRELVSGTANGFPVFRNTYDYSTSPEGTGIDIDMVFVPTGNSCLFLRINTGTSFTNAKFRFMVSDGVVKYPIILRTPSANDFALRNKIALEDRSKMLFDAAIRSKKRMLFSAHSGAEGQAPYGSYPAYELACQQGWDIITISRARQSADGTWYCLHDESVDAQTNGTGNIAILTDAYIDTIYQDVGVNIGNYTHEQMKLPTLESVLKLAYEYGVLVILRMGSLPTDYDDSSWTSFINLVKKYNPEQILFSGSLEQIIALKANTPNWHGQLYLSSNTVSDNLATLNKYGYSNISIMANYSYVDENLINAIHESGYYYVASQTENPTVDTFIGYSNNHVDIAQTGVSSIHSLH